MAETKEEIIRTKTKAYNNPECHLKMVSILLRLQVSLLDLKIDISDEIFGENSKNCPVVDPTIHRYKCQSRFPIIAKGHAVKIVGKEFDQVVQLVTEIHHANLIFFFRIRKGEPKLLSSIYFPINSKVKKTERPEQEFTIWDEPQCQSH